MAYSLYDATVSMAIGALHSLDRIITHGEQHPNSAAFFAGRLSEDMHPLTFQVHYATYQAEAVAAKLLGQDYAEPVEDLDSYVKMHARIQKALDMLSEIDRETVDGEKMTTHMRHGEPVELPVRVIVGLVYMPNIYFHVSMAYAILRKEGVPLGKRDWSRGFVREYV